jgi:lysophospholipase L1-like esterase
MNLIPQAGSYPERRSQALHWTRRRWMQCVAAVAALMFGTVAVADDDHNDRGRDQHWVASWATAPATFFVYTAPVPPDFPPGAPTARAPATIQPDQVFPFPNANTLGATSQTIRSIVKPDLWGHRLRVRFSNVFGSQPVTFSAVTIGLQEYGSNVVEDTVTTLRFSGRDSVTIPAGTEVWSDGVALDWVKNADDPRVQGRYLAVSYAVLGNSGPMTHHAAAHGTSYVSAPNSGDRTRDTNGFGYPYTTTSWFFVNAVDVMAPADTVVVCAFGDSITDGTHTTLNANDRWSDVLSKRLHEAYGNRVSVVDEGIGGNRVVNPVVANSTAGPAAVDRLDRDVLGLSGLTHVVWLEGINDLGGGHTTASIIAGYQNVVQRLHTRGVKVIGATVTSALGMVNLPEGWYPGFTGGADNGPIVNAGRLVLNSFIRTGNLFDGVADFDAATLDPATGNMRSEFLANSEFTQLPWDYLHPNHGGYLAMGLSIDIRPFRPR